MITRALTAVGIKEGHPYYRYWHSLRHSATNWLIILTGLLLYNGLNTIALIVIAPRVSKIEYGQYLACFALASFLVVMPGLGLDAWLLTQSPSDKASATALWMSTIRVRLVLLIIWLVGMIGLAIYLPADTYPLAILAPTTIGVALDQILLLSYSAMRIQGNHKLVTVVQSLSSLALLGLAWFLPLSEGQIDRFALARTGLSFSRPRSYSSFSTSITNRNPHSSPLLVSLSVFPAPFCGANLLPPSMCEPILRLFR
ncbi:MAG: oligosaccharide flippase family protein [Chloroflexi bacterium]|nr:oligosaccharide flippase family protein [Chloroflexota bacterium]